MYVAVTLVALSICTSTLLQLKLSINPSHTVILHVAFCPFVDSAVIVVVPIFVALTYALLNPFDVFALPSTIVTISLLLVHFISLFDAFDGI